jgi:CheY-like chemotaxis protein
VNTKPASAATILVIEDDPDIRSVVSMTLEAEGYAVEVATNGMEGIELAATVKPDLVVLDIMMPVVSGLEVLQHVRQRDTVPEGLTEQARRQEVPLTFGAGDDDVRSGGRRPSDGRDDRDDGVGHRRRRMFVGDRHFVANPALADFPLRRCDDVGEHLADARAAVEELESEELRLLHVASEERVRHPLDVLGHDSAHGRTFDVLDTKPT